MLLIWLMLLHIPTGHQATQANTSSNTKNTMTQSIPPSLPPLDAADTGLPWALRVQSVVWQSGRHQSSIRFGSWPRNTRNTSLRRSWFAPFDSDDDNAIDRFNTRSHTNPPPQRLTWLAPIPL